MTSRTHPNAKDARVVNTAKSNTLDKKPIITETLKDEVKITSTSIKSKNQLEIVIAHYEESLDWLTDLDIRIVFHVFIYHKGNSTKTMKDYHVPKNWEPSFYSWIPMQNVGRESHTIAHHCLLLKQGKINPNHTRSENVSLFVQGSLDERHQNLVYPLSKWNQYLPSSGEIHYVCSHPGEMFNTPGMLIHHSKWKDEKSSGAMRSTKITIEECYSFIFNRLYPRHTGIVVSYGNYFSVSNSRICEHSSNVYQRILQCLQDHVNPEEGHYLERFTRSLFAGLSISDCSFISNPPHPAYLHARNHSVPFIEYFIPISD
jgi:hypothetical protein